MNFQDKLMADLKRIMASDDIPAVPLMKELVERTAVVVDTKLQTNTKETSNV